MVVTTAVIVMRDEGGDRDNSHDDEYDDSNTGVYEDQEMSSLDFRQNVTHMTKHLRARSSACAQIRKPELSSLLPSPQVLQAQQMQS